jgi:glutaredoxin-related protein/CheY-like chemotaxis protein
MLRNLLINALNFTPEGGEVVMSCNIVDVPKTCSKSLHRREVSDTNAETVYKCNLSNFLEIKVCRSGVPLSNDRILRVKNGTNNFDIEQLQASEETGLALHVAKGIVERHGGSLTCVTPAQACGVVSYVVLLPLYELEGYNTSYLLDMSRHSDIMRGTPTEVGDSFDEVNESETIRKAQLQNRAKRVIESADVVLLLKGTPQEPLCSSSKQMVDLLTLHGVPYSYFNILSDEGIRQAVKIYSGWLAYPQLYVKGSLVGSLDNVKRLIEEKRLQDVIQNGYEGSRKAMVLRTSSLSSLASLRDMNGKNLADLTPRTIRHNVSFLNAEPGESEESSANVKKFESTSEPRPLMLDDPAAAAATDVHSLLLADSAAAAATDTHDGKAKDANKLLSTVNSPSTTAEGSETSLRMLVTGAPSAPITPIVLSPPPPVREQANSDVIFEKKRLLVVDDVLSNRKMLIRLLSKYKHTCEEAKHGAEAVEKWEDAILLGDPYDAILMDSEMPIMTGPQASRILREKGCVIPIIGITGNVLDVDVQNFKAHGADAVLPKPLNMKELIKVWKQLTSCGHAKLSTSAGNASSGVPCGEIHQPTNPVSHSLFSIKIPSHGPAKVHVAYEAMAFESQTHRMGESRNHLPHDQAMRGSDASDVQCNAVTERRDKYVAIPEAQ